MRISTGMGLALGIGLTPIGQWCRPGASAPLANLVF
jgi:hypothetical protein